MGNHSRVFAYLCDNVSSYTNLGAVVKMNMG